MDEKLYMDKKLSILGPYMIVYARLCNRRLFSFFASTKVSIL